MEKRVIEAASIMPSVAAVEALTRLCPDLDSWPQRWRGQDSDIPFGQRIVECFTPFLLHLLDQGLATKTLMRHRDHLWMLGGEIIRRLQEEPAWLRKPIKTVLLQLVDDECAPLIWPTITEQQQNSFDATCRKLHQFLTTTTRST